MKMDNSNQIPEPEVFSTVVKATEQILSNLFGSEVYFTDVQRLSEPDRRNLILRCTTVPANNFPSSFIVKKVDEEVYNPDDPTSWDSQRFFNDWVGSQFLNSLGGSTNHGPQFYGGNRDLGFIILEDMGEHRSLVEPLLHEDAGSAEAALLRYSTRLGTLHADTVNRRPVYEQLFQSISSNRKSSASTDQEISNGIEKVKTILDSLEAVPKPAFLQEVEEIVSAVLNPGPFLAYIHGDPCPDNVFDSSEQLRLIDFEFGRFGHALIDATYARMIFPTCWCANRLPQSMVVQMESRYRTELIKGCVEAQEDNIWEQALVTICGYWLLKTLEWHLESALKEDQSWGLASRRQRIVARLEAFVTTSEEFGRFPNLHDTAVRLLDALGERWPDTPLLPLYPAFQNV